MKISDLGLDTTALVNPHDFDIVSLNAFSKLEKGGVTFLTNARKMLKLPNVELALIIIREKDIKYFKDYRGTLYLCENPRLEFIRISNKFLKESAKPNRVESNIIVSKEAIIGENPSIKSGTIIAGKVRIGDNVQIGHNVIIIGPCYIGNDCSIASGVIIGEKGVGVERDNSGLAHSFPHIGGVIIGERVEIGCMSSIACGTLGDTTIASDVMIDVRCHIGHNSSIGRSSTITAGFMGGGSVKVGEFCFIGLNSTVINKVRIGDNVTINAGSTVNKNVLDGQTVAGNYAISQTAFLRKTLDEIKKYGD